MKRVGQERFILEFRPQYIHQLTPVQKTTTYIQSSLSSRFLYKLAIYFLILQHLSIFTKNKIN